MRLANRLILITGIIAAGYAAHASGPTHSQSVSLRPSFIGVFSPASGPVKLTNSNPNVPANFFEFRNTGTSNVTINQVKIVLNGKSVSLTSGPMGFGVLPGQAISVGLCGTPAGIVSQISFNVDGSTESVEVYGYNQTGPCPGGFSGGN